MGNYGSPLLIQETIMQRAIYENDKLTDTMDRFINKASQELPKVTTSPLGRYSLALRYAVSELLHVQQELAIARRKVLISQAREDALRQTVETALRTPTEDAPEREADNARGQDKGPSGPFEFDDPDDGDLDGHGHESPVKCPNCESYMVKVSEPPTIESEQRTCSDCGYIEYV